MEIVSDARHIIPVGHFRDGPPSSYLHWYGQQKLHTHADKRNTN